MYTTSVVSSLLSLLRNSVARKTAIMACATFNIKIFPRGILLGIPLINQIPSPASVMAAISKKTSITSERMEKIRKNQLLKSVLISKRAIMDIFLSESIGLAGSLSVFL
jgi:hypothetical protein